jgi:hypothetical protein
MFPLPSPDLFPVILGLLPPGLDGTKPTPPLPPLGAERPPPLFEPLPPFAINAPLKKIMPATQALLLQNTKSFLSFCIVSSNLFQISLSVFITNFLLK